MATSQDSNPQVQKEADVTAPTLTHVPTNPQQNAEPSQIVPVPSPKSESKIDVLSETSKKPDDRQISSPAEIQESIKKVEAPEDLPTHPTKTEDVTRKSSEPEIHEMPSSVNSWEIIEETDTNSQGSSIHFRSPLFQRSTKSTSCPNPLVPTIRDVEQPPNDPTERALNFVARTHEFIRWTIGSVILFVPIHYLIEAQKEEKKPGGVFSPHLLLSIIKTSIIKLLFGFDIYLAYPFCGLLVAYGTFHLAASYVSSPTMARLLEWFSLVCGFTALGVVIYFTGPWVFIGSFITAVVILGFLGIRWYIRSQEEKKDVEAAILV